MCNKRVGGLVSWWFSAKPDGLASCRCILGDISDVAAHAEHYANESWVDKLLEAGFDKTKKTLFIWQSVSLYLKGELVKETLSKMADLCVEGSIIAQDFYSESFLSCEVSNAIKRMKKTIEKMGEPWEFGIDMSDDPRATVESFLNECGLKMTEINQFGEKLDIEPFYCIVEAKKL